MESQPLNENQLKILATKVRLGIIESVGSAKSGHPGGSLSVADVLTYLYNREMNVDPSNPTWEDRDRFVLSKGHAAPALYAVLANRGYFSVDLLPTLRQVDSHLQGHPSLGSLPGVDMTTGSLGQGISAACGMALAAKLNGRSYRTYTIVGDGESEEGQVWEAAMFAAHRKLDNLCVVLDWNGLQIDGEITKVMNPTPHKEKFEAFGFHTITIDGHDFRQIADAFSEARETKGRPTVIISRSVKGKGVSYMENRPEWHGNAPKGEQLKQAFDELHATLARLEAEEKA